MSEWCRSCYSELDCWVTMEVFGKRSAWCPDCGALRPKGEDFDTLDYMAPEDLLLEDELDEIEFGGYLTEDDEDAEP